VKKDLSKYFIYISTGILFFSTQLHGQLKSIVYDFDGLDIGETSLPEGEYGNYDLAYHIAATPLTTNDMLGDRVLKLDLNWSTGTGSFGRGIARYVEFDANQDRLNFFFYNPTSNNQAASFEVTIGDDDNQSNAFEGGSDDTWKKTFTVPGSEAWQLFSTPLKDFTDGNSAGNGVFDIAFTENKGMLLFVEFKFNKANPASSNAVFYLDMINFSEGELPQGASVFDLPGKSNGDYCILGAYSNEQIGQYDLTPSKFEAFFPHVDGKKIRYVNTFIHWGYGGMVPNAMPGNAAQNLINNGYVPILTWEPMFAGYDRLDPVQPRLDNIINGDYDSYIDAFADQCKTLSDTIIIRFMHEFEGDWYPWSITYNNQDPTKYATAFRKVVDRFRAKGATKVKWMWCVNSDYTPYRYYNWVVKAYPGDAYVDIVATDIYNNHFPINLPWWRSFRWQTTESYYYLTKYFPNKPLFICEVGCRERFSSENPASESKGAWYARMDKELQSNYHKARALIFFHAYPDQNWLVNSSPSALQSLVDNVWQDDYYFRPFSTQTLLLEIKDEEGYFIYPNPTDYKTNISYISGSLKDSFKVSIVNFEGKILYTESFLNVSDSFSLPIDVNLPRGIYYVQMTANYHNDPDKKSVKRVKKLVVL
jgi:hypothetical protein